MSRLCSVPDCRSPHYGNGLCNKHWLRVRAHGTTDGGQTTHAPPEVRFWRYVEKRGPDDCWLWTGKTEKNGYGRFQIGGKGSPQLGAHRVSYQMANGGESPPVVMHKCDNRPCVNPAHLRAGTHKENTADMHAKGRYIGRGPTAAGTTSLKFTPDDIRAIKQRTGESANAVARDYGVNHGSILAIWRGITWKHIT